MNPAFAISGYVFAVVVLLVLGFIISKQNNGKIPIPKGSSKEELVQKLNRSMLKSKKEDRKLWLS